MTVRAWSALHRLQERPDWCVPACAAMVHARAGREVAKADLAIGAAGTFDLYGCAEDFGSSVIPMKVNPDPATVFPWLEYQLHAGVWVVLSVMCADIVRSMATHFPAVRSPHGPLPEALGSLHAVVLVEVDPTRWGFLYLDPYFPRDPQPLFMTQETLAGAFQGTLILVP